MQRQHFRNLAVNNVTSERDYKFHAHDHVILVSARQPHRLDPKTAKRNMRLTLHEGLGSNEYRDGSRHAHLFAAGVKSVAAFHSVHCGVHS